MHGKSTQGTTQFTLSHSHTLTRNHHKRTWANMAKSKDNEPLSKRYKEIRNGIRKARTTDTIAPMLRNIQHAKELHKNKALTSEQFAGIVEHLLKPIAKPIAKPAPPQKEPKSVPATPKPARPTTIDKNTQRVIKRLAKKPTKKDRVQITEQDLTAAQITKHIQPSPEPHTTKQKCGLHRCTNTRTHFPPNPTNILLSGNATNSMCRECFRSTQLLRNPNTKQSGITNVKHLPLFEPTFGHIQSTAHLQNVLRSLNLNKAAAFLNGKAKRHYIQDTKNRVIVFAYKHSIQYPELMAVFASKLKGIVYINGDSDRVKCWSVAKCHTQGLQAPLPRVIEY